MIDPISCMEKLDAAALELDNLSKSLADVERRLEPVEERYQKFVDDFELGLWAKHQNHGEKLPPAPMRLKLAHCEIAPDLLGQYSALIHSRKRMQARIDSLCKAVSAQQSILKGLRGEQDAAGYSRSQGPTYGGQRA